MDLRKLKDSELILKLKTLVQHEREVLTSVLHHLLEVDRRKLFSDFGYPSLFEYAVNELKYSEGQAGRRIQAMRLLRELPQLEEKIQSGAMSLSNLSQAQSLFRDTNSRLEKSQRLTSDDKLEILEKIENKSAREAQKILLSRQPEMPLPKERVRLISETNKELSFVIDEKLAANLEQVRSLLGLKGINMSFGELAFEMSELSLKALKEKAFGKKRISKTTSQALELNSTSPFRAQKTIRAAREQILTSAALELTPTSELNNSNTRYISKATKFQVWQRDQEKCQNCGGSVNLNFDHIEPFGLGGCAEASNLRLLCFHCNQRRSIKTYGQTTIRRNAVKQARL